ncbi:MAG: hypothetical protein JRJ44_06920 [Deltaproteobacteria bacterium]|nr:hypothetical protein [Deltaproteobacteria bacterium]
MIYTLKKKQGEPVDDFDLLIGVSSVVSQIVMVTNNPSHFERIRGIEIENWTK